MATGKPNETLVAFKSGHYKKVRGTWRGDSVWMHFEKESGGAVSVNKAEVEYIETFGQPESPKESEMLPDAIGFEFASDEIDEDGIVCARRPCLGFKPKGA